MDKCQLYCGAMTLLSNLWHCELTPTTYINDNVQRSNCFKSPAVWICVMVINIFWDRRPYCRVWDLRTCLRQRAIAYSSLLTIECLLIDVWCMMFVPVTYTCWKNIVVVYYMGYFVKILGALRPLSSSI